MTAKTETRPGVQVPLFCYRTYRATSGVLLQPPHQKSGDHGVVKLAELLQAGRAKPIATTHSVQGDSPLVPWVPAAQVAAFVVSTRSRTIMARRAMWLGRFRIIVCQSNVAGVCRATVRNDCADNWNLACTAG